MGADLGDVEREGLSLLTQAPDGPGLTPRTVALIAYAAATCATSLNPQAIDRATATALRAGVSEKELVEVMLLVSAVGMHALHEGVIALRRAADPPPPPKGLRERHEHAGTYWSRFEEEIPGFLGGMAGWFPEGYEAFLDYCRTPVRTGTLARLEREFVWISIDATPTHRYVPGLRFHIRCAVALGATRQQVEEVITRAARAPAHVGVERHQ